MKKYVETLWPYACGKLLEVESNLSDCIEICNSESFDVDALCVALKGQAKHGALAEALPWLFLDEPESGEIALMMKDGGKREDWLKPYAAVYWFVCGWSDAEFANSQRKQSNTLP